MQRAIFVANTDFCLLIDKKNMKRFFRNSKMKYIFLERVEYWVTTLLFGSRSLISYSVYAAMRLHKLRAAIG